MKRLSQASKLLIAMCALLILANVSLATVLIVESAAALRTQIEERMLDVSNTAAAVLDGDVLRDLRAEDADTPEYQQVLRTLLVFYNNIELSYIYCVRDVGGGEFVFMIDSDTETPAAFGERIEYTDALYAASLGVPGVDKDAYEDRWGRFYSAYSPVFDSDGRVSGIVAVDFSADWFENQIRNQVVATITICVMSIGFASLIVVIVASRFRKRFRDLLGEMNNVSGGIETLVCELAPGAAVAVHSEDVENAVTDELEGLSDRIRSLEGMLSDQISIVRSQAYIDGLTGLGNRVAYEEQVKRLDDGIGEGSAVFAVAVFDLNGLKQINDRFGHEKGDETIIAAAELLRGAFPGRMCCRIGGDEFVVIAEGGTGGMAEGMACVGASAAVSMAQGLAEYEPGADTCYREVFNRADLAMYHSKREYYKAHPESKRH